MIAAKLEMKKEKKQLQEYIFHGHEGSTNPKLARQQNTVIVSAMAVLDTTGRSKLLHVFI